MPADTLDFRALITLENGGIQFAYSDVAQMPQRAQAATAYAALDRDIACQLHLLAHEPRR